jgi:hypothetical protein
MSKRRVLQAELMALKDCNTKLTHDLTEVVNAASERASRYSVYWLY